MDHVPNIQAHQNYTYIEYCGMENCGQKIQCMIWSGVLIPWALFPRAGSGQSLSPTCRLRLGLLLHNPKAQARGGLVFGPSQQSRPQARTPGQARPAKAGACSVKPEPNRSLHFTGPIRPYFYHNVFTFRLLYFRFLWRHRRDRITADETGNWHGGSPSSGSNSQVQEGRRHVGARQPATTIQGSKQNVCTTGQASTRSTRNIKIIFFIIYICTYIGMFPQNKQPFVGKTKKHSIHPHKACKHDKSVFRNVGFQNCFFSNCCFFSNVVFQNVGFCNVCARNVVFEKCLFYEMSPFWNAVFPKCRFSELPATMTSSKVSPNWVSVSTVQIRAPDSNANETVPSKQDDHVRRILAYPHK
jgi:hypothetical protein